MVRDIKFLLAEEIVDRFHIGQGAKAKENFIEIDSLTNEIQKREIKKNPFCKICKKK